jgi:two-component SAPR family response regulator
MPGINGFELLRRVAEMPGHVGRVLITGYREYLDKVPDERAPWFLVIKPYDPAHLLRVVERAWSATQLRRSASEAARLTRTRE